MLSTIRPKADMHRVAQSQVQTRAELWGQEEAASEICRQPVSWLTESDFVVISAPGSKKYRMSFFPYNLIYFQNSLGIPRSLENSPLLCACMGNQHAGENSLDLPTAAWPGL